MNHTTNICLFLVFPFPFLLCILRNDFSSNQFEQIMFFSDLMTSTKHEEHHHHQHHQHIQRSIHHRRRRNNMQAVSMCSHFSLFCRIKQYFLSLSLSSSSYIVNPIDVGKTERQDNNGNIKMANRYAFCCWFFLISNFVQ